MATRDELVVGVRERYANSERGEKTRILDEFVAVTGFHRKHAMRVLRGEQTTRGAPRPARRLYDEAVRDALIVIWEASDRICGKRLKPLVPLLVGAMERHKHLQLAPDIRARLLAMSAATIDRALRTVREHAGGRSRRRAAPSLAVRRRVPVRTFSDWHNPPPGFVEADLVAHSGPSASGSFVQTLVVTDVATGWTECAPLLVREQNVLSEVLTELRKLLPFKLLGLDTDNDSVFMNETVHDYCQATGVVFTRCRPYRKNDQAFVEQKNGAVVRRVVGYRRLEGLVAATALARLYATVRLFVNFFQPSFKLAEKERDGARVRKRYHRPATPCQRLLADPRTSQEVRDRVTALYAALDPVRLLSDMRAAQQQLVDIADRSFVSTSVGPTRFRSMSSWRASALHGKRARCGRLRCPNRNKSGAAGDRTRWRRSLSSCTHGSLRSLGELAVSCLLDCRSNIRDLWRWASAHPPTSAEDLAQRNRAHHGVRCDALPAAGKPIACGVRMRVLKERSAAVLAGGRTAGIEAVATRQDGARQKEGFGNI
jgi:hypothetical protein